MLTEETENMNLLSGTELPRYGLQSTISRHRYQRVKRFQCCILIILLFITIAVIVFTISYGMNSNITKLDAPNLLENDFSNNTNILLSLSWPILDKKQDRFCVEHHDDWNKALVLGSAALEELDGIEQTASMLNKHSPSFRHRKSFMASNRTRYLSRLGFITEFAQKYLQRKYTMLSTGVCINTGKNITIKCNMFKQYRSYDGTCNNLNHPLKFGVAFTPFRRSLPANYADGISKPRIDKYGKNLPSARTVSLTVHRPIYKNDNRFTVMLAIWGQFIDHDITATALPQGKFIACCSNHFHPDCFPVKIDKDDPYYSSYNITCLEFVRSAAAPLNNIGSRQQFNQASAFLDASVIYGSHQNITRTLREFKNGKLKMYVTANNRTLLPISTDPNDGCNREEENRLGRYCFMTGDQRANENLHLTCMHLIWARQHNYVASELQKLNSHWNDEKVFQEVRRIIAAQIQHITYNEFLKSIIGFELMDKLDLNSRKKGYYKGYDNGLDASIANSFATSAFRFGHTLIPMLIKFLNNNSSNPEYVQFHRMLFNPYTLYQSDGLDKSLRGALNTTIEASDTYFNSEVSGHLFEETRKNMSSEKHFCGLDLVSLNIQRGRDHGIPGYSDWRQFCGLHRPRNFSELTRDIDKFTLTRIQLVYRDVDDIDLYTGAISEKPISNGILGPTFTCLITDQFLRLKKGDRMWYENPVKPQAFTLEQLEQIRSTTLSRIICDNSDNVDRVQPYVMQRVGEGNEYTSCTGILRPDLTKWKDADLSHINILDKSISVKQANTTFF